MTEGDYRLLLRQTLDSLERAAGWLRRSQEICKGIDLAAQPSEEKHDALEALGSRFARASDLLVQRAFRGIDRAELEDPGSVLDVLARAEKRGLIESVEQFRLVREVRNEIAHEYLLEDLTELFERVREYTPLVLRTIETTQAYAAKFAGSEEESDEVEGAS